MSHFFDDDDDGFKECKFYSKSMNGKSLQIIDANDVRPSTIPPFATLKVTLY